MSRIGKLPVTVPAGVEVTISDANLVTVKGPKGSLTEQICDCIKVELVGSEIVLTAKDDSTDTNAKYGLSRSLVANMVEGVVNGYSKKLTMLGVGYKAEKKGNTLVMSLGFSHPVEMVDPEGITTTVLDPTTIVVSGASKELVGNYAANIRKWRKPEPYKGKGIRYDGEIVRRKEGKTGK